MAKISARGDTLHARFRHPETGAEIVLTNQGRVLSKVKGGGFTLLDRFHDVHGGRRLDRAMVLATARGMERV